MIVCQVDPQKVIICQVDLYKVNICRVDVQKAYCMSERSLKDSSLSGIYVTSYFKKGR